MTFNTKNAGYIICCFALSLALGISTFMSLVSVGVIAEYERDHPKSSVTQSVDNAPVTDNDTFLDNYSDEQIKVDDDGVTSVIIVGDGQSSDDGTDAVVEITATDIVEIYAELMNGAKERAPAFKKIEYQVLPDDPENRVITEGEDAVNSVMGVIMDLGVFVPEDQARANPYYHTKGDGDMSLFPVFNMPKGSYLTDPNGIKSYVYEELDNGNVKIKFMLVSEDNPEPVAEGSDIAPSYTGAVFSPMSKAKIDRTINHPIIGVFAQNISYSLRYHDCYVEFEYNPETMELVSLNHIVYVTIKGSGDVGLVGKMNVEKQELESYVYINEFDY